MKGLVGVPRIVHHLGATVVVGAHGEQVLLRQIHHPLGFILIVGGAIGMNSIVEVGEVTVEVHVVAVVTFCSCYRVVATIISAIRVGAGENEQIDILEDVLDAVVGAGAELIDESKHEDHAGHFITVHGGSVKELRLAVGIAFVETDTQDSAVVGGGKGTQVKEGAVGTVGHGVRESFHHSDIVTVSQVAVPIVSGTVAAFPHGGFLTQ